jgi:hypothetical protein
MQEFWLALMVVMAVAAIVLIPISHFLGRLSMREPPDITRLFRRRSHTMLNHPPRACTVWYGPSKQPPSLTLLALRPRTMSFRRSSGRDRL